MEYSADIRTAILPEDLIIAADGGAGHCRELGIIPTVIIGDFDSIHPEDLARFEAAGSKLLRHPIRKNYTDLESALDHAVKSSANEIVLFGALGARWDMSLANILLFAKYGASRIRIIEGQEEIIPAKGPGEITIEGEKGDGLSLVPAGGDACGISLYGLEYPLENEILKFGSTRGISNVLVEKKALVHIEQGLLLCIHTRCRSTIIP